MKRIFEPDRWRRINEATERPVAFERRWGKERRADRLKEDGTWDVWPPWATYEADRCALRAAVLEVCPHFIVETGTAEGVSASILVRAAPLGATFVTFDYDGDPFLPSAPARPGEDYATPDDWRELAAIRSENLETLRRERPDLQVRYRDGDTRYVLPSYMEALTRTPTGPRLWDFWYQDSNHHFDGIRAEWEAMLPFASETAVVVFDDVEENERDPHPWFVHFRDRYGAEWEYRSTARVGGNHQLWAQRRGPAT